MIMLMCSTGNCKLHWFVSAGLHMGYHVLVIGYRLLAGLRGLSVVFFQIFSLETKWVSCPMRVGQCHVQRCICSIITLYYFHEHWSYWSKLGYAEGKSPILGLQSSNSSVSSKSDSPCRFMNWCSNDIRGLAKGPLWGVMRGIFFVSFLVSLGSQSTVSAGVPDARTGHLQGEPRMEEMPFEKGNYLLNAAPYCLCLFFAACPRHLISWQM